MNEVDGGKAMILELVTALARGEGIDSSSFLFQWDQAVLVMEEFGLTLDDKVYSLRVLLGKRSQFLPFSETAVRAGVEDPRDFARVHREYIMSALRRLRSTATVLEPAGCQGAGSRPTGGSR